MTAATMLPHHAALIAGSGIAPEVATARGYRSVTKKAELAALGFPASQQLVPALLLPVYGVTGEIATYQIRPDTPRMDKDSGKILKYETMAKSQMRLDVPLGARGNLDKPSVPLFITEGARKADAAVSRGLCCVALLGVWNWRGTNKHGGKVALPDWEMVALNDRQVYIVFDSDVMEKESVALALSRLTDFLKIRKARVKVIYLPSGPGASKVGLDDYFVAGKCVDDLMQLAGNVRPLPLFEPREAKPSAPNSQSLPKIFVTTDVKRVVDEAEAAIGRCSTIEIYQRARDLVRIVRAGHKKTRAGLERDPSAPIIGSVPAENLFELMTTAANWFKVVEKKDGPEHVQILPPNWAVTALAARPSWEFRDLEAIVEAPCLRPDGSILDKPGYDEATGILFESAITFDAIPDRPTVEEARAAFAAIVDVIDQFPFVERCDKSAMVAAILTPLARPAINGPVPLFAIRAPAAGSGKSKLCHVASIVATGRLAAVMAQSDDPNEERKRILSIGLEGDRVVLIDNVEKPLGSDVLAGALTGTTFKDRLLGSNKTAEVPLVATWFASGNNLVVKGDLGRRVVPIDIDAKVEDPEKRGNWKYPDLLDHVRKIRPALVKAGLTILRAFIEAKPTTVELSGFGSFEAWSRLVRAAIVWLGEPDPCAGRERIRADSDPELATIRDALTIWREVLGDEWLTVGQVVEKARSANNKKYTDLSPDDRRVIALREALAAFDPRSDGERIDPKRLGYALRKYKGRIVGGLRLQGSTKGMNGVRWRVRKASEKDEIENAPEAGEVVAVGDAYEPPMEGVDDRDLAA